MRDRSLALRLAVTLLLGAAAPARAGKDLAVDDVQRNVPAGPQFAPELDGANVHNVGSIQMHVTNFGLLGSLPGSRAPYADVPSAQWPAGSGVEYLYGGGLWVGARVNGEARVSGIIETSERVQFEFRPGVTELDRIYRSREQAPGGARAPAINADDDGDRRIDEDRLDGRDNDGDGAIDEDYAAISNQMFYCEFADTDPGIRYTVPDHRPLGLHVEQTTLEWEGDAAAGFIGLDYRITNVGREVLDELYVGFFADFDVGGRQRAITSQDDLSGFWRGEATVGGRTLPLELGYTFDDDGDDGSAEGYVGLVFLGYQTRSRGVQPLALRNYRAALGTGGLDAGGDATNDVERYAILEGSAARSLPPPGDPERRSEVGRYIGDYRGVYSAGPLPALGPGASVRFQAALVIAGDLDALVERATVALQTFAGGWFDCDRDRNTGVLGRETSVCGPEEQGRIRIDPCDANCDRVEVPPCTEHVPAAGCIWINDDCDTEIETDTPTGVDGRECLVNWLADSPPVPPGMRVVPRQDRVEIYWDDTSEVTPDLLRGVYDFESYRLWRADGWTRPQGTNERSGPAHELWSLIGEYDLPRNRVGADTGLGPVSYAPQIPPTLVEFYRRWFEMHPDDAPPDVMGFTEAQLDTAQALAKGRRYYMFTDPPFLPDAAPGGACLDNGLCPDVVIGGRSRPARCGTDGRCHATLPPPHPGMHLFYAVSATDHTVSPPGPGLAGDPAGNFLYVTMPSTALPVERAGDVSEEVYVVPNPATPLSMAPWQLQPNNDDPTGLKVEFHHLPQSTGKVTIWTLAGDRVRELPFDGRDGNGTLPWDLVSRNGQDVSSGVYLYTVESDDGSFERFVGKLVVVR